jgi:hypothetical protein
MKGCERDRNTAEDRRENYGTKPEKKRQIPRLAVTLSSNSELTAHENESFRWKWEQCGSFR